jgi:glutathione S-transferase
MMILRSSPASPFGRKVKIAAALLGLSGRIEVVLADTTDPYEALRTQNPLGKIPALILEDGRVLYDSPAARSSRPARAVSRR